MAEGKKSFVLYCDIIHTVQKMPKDKAGELFMMILSYVNDKNPDPGDLIVDLVFEPIKQQLKRDLKKWDKYIEKQHDNGLKGGRPIKPKETQKTQPLNNKPKKADSVNVSVSVNDNDSVINTERENTDHTHEKLSPEFVSLKTKEKKYSSPGAKFWNTRPGISQNDLPLPPTKLMSVIELFKITKNTDVDIGKVEGLWSIFKSQNFNEEKFYQSESEVYKHFMNWCKGQSIQNNGTHQQSFTKPANRKSAGAEQLLASLKADIAGLSGSGS